nr:hypothetical protein OG999_14505 [Streptomyces sp. NBC_00886]
MNGNDSEDALAGVRYIVDDVQAAIDFCTTHLDFTVLNAFPPAVADVIRGPLRFAALRPARLGSARHASGRRRQRAQPHPPRR